MHPIFIFIAGAIAGFLIARKIKGKNPFMNKKARELLGQTQENKLKIIDYLKKNQKITNDDVENLLKVGNTSAYKYLEDMERQGIIIQKGKTGRNVHYTLKN